MNIFKRTRKPSYSKKGMRRLVERHGLEEVEAMIASIVAGRRVPRADAIRSLVMATDPNVEEAWRRASIRVDEAVRRSKEAEARSADIHQRLATAHEGLK